MFLSGALNGIMLYLGLMKISLRGVFSISSKSRIKLTFTQPNLIKNKHLFFIFSNPYKQHFTIEIIFKSSYFLYIFVDFVVILKHYDTIKLLYALL